MAGPVKSLGFFFGIVEADIDQGMRFIEDRDRVALPLGTPTEPVLDQAFLSQASFLPEELFGLRSEILLELLYVR
jgi:hypothetical protein